MAWLDIYKGIAIILVVIGHLEIPDSLYKYIYVFHLYAFFFAAGITFKINSNETFKGTLKKNMNRLYIPYLFFAFMWDVTNMIVQVTHGIHYDFTFSALSHNVIEVLFGRSIIPSNASIGPAWFLLCLLVVRIIFWAILRMSKNNYWIQFTICALLFILGHQLRDYEFLPFFMIQSLTTFIFVFMGYAIKEYFLRKTNTLSTLFLLIVAIFSVLATVMWSQLSNCKLILLNNILPDNILVLLCAAVSGIVSLYCISIICSRVLYVNSVLIWCGINSLIIMGTHMELRTASNLLLGGLPISTSLMLVVKTFIILLLSYPAVYLLKTYCPFFIYGNLKCTRIQS